MSGTPEQKDNTPSTPKVGNPFPAQPSGDHTSDSSQPPVQSPVEGPGVIEIVGPIHPPHSEIAELPPAAPEIIEFAGPIDPPIHPEIVGPRPHPEIAELPEGAPEIVEIVGPVDPPHHPEIVEIVGPIDPVPHPEIVEIAPPVYPPHHPEIIEIVGPIHPPHSEIAELPPAPAKDAAAKPHLPHPTNPAELPR